MPKKLHSKEQSKKQYIKNLIKNSKEVCAGFRTPEEAKECYSNYWFHKYYLLNNDYSVRQLLDPERQPLTIKDTPSSSRENGRLIGHNGLWRICIHPRSRKSLDFDIAVKSGSQYRFHSRVIQHSIVSRHGTEVYDQWRRMVKDDIESLRTLVSRIKSQLTCVPWSYTCSQSAANLCEQVGVSTYRGTAFLFPDSFA
jgi:hypothetical protein